MRKTMSFSSGGRFLRIRRSQDLFVAEHARLFVLAGGEEDHPLAGHLPVQLPREKLPPPLAQGPQPRVGRAMPIGHADQQRPLGELQVLVEVLQRVAGKEVGLAVDEQFLQASGRWRGPCGGNRPSGTSRPARR